MRRIAAAALSMVVLCGASPSHELTPEQRALIFGKPEAVKLAHRVARIRMAGTDRRGFYRCSYVRVTLNGHGPYTFLFDTGAAFTSLTTKVIESARLPITVERGGFHDVIRVEHMRVGDVDIHNLVAVRDDNFGVDGVLGFHTFGDMNLTFDFQKRELLVSEEPLEMPGAFEVPYVLEKTLPTIPVKIGTQDVAMMIDTGDDAYACEVRSSDLKGATFAHEPRTADEVRNGANVSRTSVTTLASAIQLGPLTINDAVVGINDALPVPDFGVEFLKAFRFSFNQKQSTVAFQRVVSPSAVAIRGNLSPGFMPRFDESGTVSSVVPGSDASSRGMKAGDRIVSIDGRVIRNITPRTWDHLLATRDHLVVRWIDDGKETTASFAVAELR
ncbi:MAG TPA: aspartyl protease family protein [Thermoanaerobaculia bacterium]|nr:aspartyl protease family protein [Thermoanaerobaculia bacterium]